MKKRVLCFFSLILYLLCACTILSLKIEQEAMVEVECELRATSESRSATSVRISSVYTDLEGDHMYQVVDGTGWETGLRIAEIPKSSWTLNINPNGLFYAQVSGGEDYRIVFAGSRQPQAGERVRMVEDFVRTSDEYLGLYPSGVMQPLEPPRTLTVAAQGENAVLFACEDAQLPFLPANIKTSSVTTDRAQRIISLTEAEQLLRALPSAAVLGAVLLFGLILWAASCCFGLRAEELRGLICCNTVLIVVSLGVLAYAATRFDLPSSMLPPKNLLQWSYYTEEYAQILSALEDMGMQDHVLVSLCPAMVREAAYVLWSGPICALTVLLLERFTMRFRMRRCAYQNQDISTDSGPHPDAAKP